MARRPGMIALAVIGGILALVWLSPFWFVAINSFKEFGAILKDAAGWPNPFILDNYPTAWESAMFVSAFMNSLIITVVSVASMILIGALAAWRMARMPHRVNKLIFFVFVSAFSMRVLAFRMMVFFRSSSVISEKKARRNSCSISS